LASDSFQDLQRTGQISDQERIISSELYKECDCRFESGSTESQEENKEDEESTNIH